MQFVSEGSGAKTTHTAREEASNPEPPRFEDGKSLYDRLNDNKEKKLQLDSERVSAGGPSAISEEEYMFFIELERKQKHLSKQVDRETEAFQKQVQSLAYQPDALLALPAHRPKQGAKKDVKKPRVQVVPKAIGDADQAHSPSPSHKRKARDEEEHVPAKRSKHVAEEPEEDAQSGLGALLGSYGSDPDE